MSETTNIAWCDSTVNFWEGCTKVSAGCAHCYAEARDKRFTGGIHWGPGAARRKSKSAVKQALAMNRKPYICDHCGNAFASASDAMCCCDLKSKGVRGSYHRRRVFSLSLGDWLDDEVPTEWLAEMLDTIRQCDQVTWMLCTKRPEAWGARLEAVLQWIEAQPEFDESAAVGNELLSFRNWLADWFVLRRPPKNIILLTSVENQEQADKRIPELLKIPAACRGLSLEPLLGPVLLPAEQELSGGGISWLIAGGESGPQARPCNVEWIRSLVQQGQAAGVATFVKQLGANPIFQTKPFEQSPAYIPRDKKGGDPAEWPADLRVQQWPKGF